MDYSIIIPAYNEGSRLPAFLLDLTDYLDRFSWKGEIIVVDDGSDARNHEAYESLISQINRPNVTLVCHEINKGKGAAVKSGFLQAKGEWIGFADADGATSPKEIIRVLGIAKTSEHLDGVFGSRIRMLGYDLDRKVSRHITGRVFVTLFNFLFGIPAYDPQCGCKFFKRSKLGPHIPNLQQNGYLIDIELIELGFRNRWNFLEVPIHWQDKAGSKVSLLFDPIKMAKDLIVMRHSLGRKSNAAKALSNPSKV